MKTFEYSPEQKEIIAHRGSHLQVLACAGSGKTTAMAGRVASLLAEGVPPEAVIAFTFTEKAAAALKARIEAHVVDTPGLGKPFLDKLNPMFVGTIHAYCLRLLQEHVPKYAAYDVLDEHRLVALVSREHGRLGLRDLSLGFHWEAVRVFLQNVDFVENELVPPGKLGKGAFSSCYRKLCAMLDGYRLLTYGQLISKAVEELRKPHVAKKVRRPLRHLIVDEYQDINPAQEEFIRLLAADPVELCVVGDDDQSIYQWRGSNVSNILTFVKRYGKKGRKVAVKPLLVNRRSRPKVITEARRFVKTIHPRLAKEMREHRAAGGPEVVRWSAETAKDEAELIARTILTLRKEGFRYGDIGILLRSVRTSSEPFIEAFRRNGIPFACAGRTGLFLQPEPQALAMIYAWLVDEAWDDETPSRSAIVTELRDLFNVGSAQARRLTVQLDAMKEEVQDPTTRADLVGDLSRILRLLGVHDWNLLDPATAASMGTLARLTELLADFEHSRQRSRPSPDEPGEFIGGTNRGFWYYKTLYWYLKYYAQSAYQDFEGEERFGEDVVDLMTVHQAKGLDWPVVFVPCLTNSRFPSKWVGRARKWLVPKRLISKEIRERYEGRLVDERRLFYVAMTRAKDCLHLSRFQRIKNRVGISQFLEETGGSPPVKEALAMPPKPERTKPPEERPLIPFSNLADYEYCPHSFRLRNLMRFQPSIFPELGYGKSVHHILRRIANHVQDTGKLPSQEEVDRVFREEFYLPLATKPAFRQMKAAAEKLVNGYLKKYGEDLKRVWETERPFELHLGEATITGRADVILDREGGRIGSMAIVDYKTAVENRTDEMLAFQLAVYTAAGRSEGIDVRGAYVHDLRAGERLALDVSQEPVKVATARAEFVSKSLRSGAYPYKPGGHCASCDVRWVCRHGKVKI